jgi:hypothetical protein
MASGGMREEGVVVVVVPRDHSEESSHRALARHDSDCASVCQAIHQPDAADVQTSKPFRYGTGRYVAYLFVSFSLLLAREHIVIIQKK